MVNIVFLHPDLGIGGAERLVVDAALALQQKGHVVQFVTSHHDPSHCFSETRDGTFVVTVAGDWLPRSIFGRFFALCAYIRMLYAAIYIAYFSELQPQIIFCDQISACIPILRVAAPQIIFYCHFPDQLLSQSGSFMKSIYRAPLNWWEERTTGQANRVLVNSKFTGRVFKDTFKRLSLKPDVLYPSINTDFFDRSTPVPLSEIIPYELPSGTVLFLSINRYERKKNLSLAIKSLHKLKDTISPANWEKVHLIMIGGYDTRVEENVDHFQELVDQCKQLDLTGKVTFLKSPSDIVKVSLLHHSDCLIYTPSNEHFGIVPLEAMYARKPVIAVNSGGPTETVCDGEGGFLCQPQPEEFSAAMAKLFASKELRLEMGEKGHRRMKENFSFKAFGNQLEAIVQSMLTIKSKKH